MTFESLVAQFRFQLILVTFFANFLTMYDMPMVYFFTLGPLLHHSDWDYRNIWDVT